MSVDPASVSAAPEPEPEMELTIAGSPPPIEDVIAARRAKRAAMRAKLEEKELGVNSITMTDVGSSCRFNLQLWCL